MPTYTTTLRLNDSIISVDPLPASQFSAVRAYQYVSIGTPPNVIHARDPLQTPDGTPLNTNAIFFETRVDNRTNPPTFTQRAIDGALSAGEIKIHEYDVFLPFTYPGTIDTQVQGNESSGSDQDISVSLILEGPVSAEVQATVYEFIQTSDDLDSGDYTYQSASGLWSPNQWASLSTTGSTGAAGDRSRFNDSQDFRGYRTVSSGTLVDVVAGADANRLYYNGVLRLKDLQDANDCTFSITAVEQGPSDPVGSKWVLDLDLQPAFSGADGTAYYKKTIVVSDTIPAQIDNDVPYNDS